MPGTPKLTVLDGGRTTRALVTARESSLPDSWDLRDVDTVEIVAPDRYCATLLLDHAAPLFPAEIVSDAGWIVRFRPPPTRTNWVIELLALIEAWLSIAPLPCAKVRHGGREFLVRAPSRFAPTAPTPWEAA